MAELAAVDSYPLTPIQQGMLFHHLHEGNVGVDIEQMVGRLHEQLDIGALEHAWAETGDRHPILRTRFRWTDEHPVQEVVDHVDVPVVVHDLRGQSVDEQTARVDEFMVDDRLLGFDLAVAPLWRLTLFTLADDDHQFVFTYHHSLLDVSVVWVVEEAFRGYDAARAGESVEFEQRRPFRDHIEWLQQHLAADRAAAAEYYRGLLEGFEAATELPSLTRPTALDTAGLGYGAERFRLDDELSAAIHALHADQRITPAVLIETAWGLVLAAFSGTTDVVFGSTRGARRTGVTGSDRTVGLFINTPPVRLRMDPRMTARELLDAMRTQQVDKRAHEHTPLTEIQAVAETSGALFETIVVINELHQGTRLRNLGGAFETREFDLHDQTNFPLTLLAYTDPSIHFKISSDRRRFDDDAIERVRSLFVDVLRGLVAGVDAPVGLLPRLPAGDRALLQQWNATERDYPRDACIHELFEAQVDRTPNSVALRFRDRALTYRELDRQANVVAHHLRGLGVGPDSTVGVYIDRSVSMMVGLLGILKAGGCYVPMDPGYPPVRIAMMLEDSRADVVLTQASLRHTLPGDAAHVVVIDELLAESPDGTERRARPDGLTSDHLGYVIFTSGSTGRPKGVMIEQRNVVNFFVAMDDQLGFDTDTAPGTWLAVTSISFDISVLELFWTLTRGFTVVLQEDEARIADLGAHAAASPARPMQFSLFYFAADAAEQNGNRYRLLIEGAKFADQHDFAAVWTPERHFHEFGGLYPNAAVTSAAVAMVTDRISIRAGSVVLPLHNPIRCAEDWSVVDNLSNGRVGLSFASGWHANDFALAPDNFADRRAIMSQGIDTIRALWRGEHITTTSGDGREIQVRMYPPPVQSEPPVWITAGGSADTFTMAGRIGASILTNLLVMGHDDLVRNIAAYREAYRAAGHPGDGHISLMLHTYVGRDLDDVRATVRDPFLDYLRTSTDLINQVQWEQTSFAKPDAQRSSGEGARNLDELNEDEMAVIMDHAFDRYFRTAGLFGTPQSCVETIDRLRDLGVDEIACLIDFGVDADDVLANLTQLDALRRLCDPGEPGSTEALVVASALVPDDGVDYGVIAQIQRHQVTHLQCTPSLAAIIAAQANGIGAISSLEKLMLGGEALPPALVDRIRPLMRGQLLNMYGPTETTIWSTVSPILAAGEPITIGRPIANTTIFIVDPNLLANPIGAAGELLIGGDGVVRGYHDRPELTAERFVDLPAAGARMYRTGDLARWLPNGEIEFSGRLDHQVKIRGYRIELGEIEAAIGRHPAAHECVVVARADTPGEPRLVAYVVPERSDAPAGTDAWAEIWDDTYRHGADGDATFDISGWNDSYTGVPIPAEQMRDWVNATVARIDELGPRRVLEIGCGTGLLLFGIAPHVQRYVGIDGASSALERIGRQLDRSPLPQVSLIQGFAHDVRSLVDESFDTIIINSVAQYFPDADYLVRVIADAMSMLTPDGALYLGDLRGRDQLPLFAAAVELARSTDDMAAADLAERATRRAEQDEELVIDPALFGAVAAAMPELGSWSIRLKPGRFDNEMTRFRYDAVLRRSREEAADQGDIVELDAESASTARIREVLDAGPAIVRVVGFRNSRLVHDAELCHMLESEPGIATVKAVRARVSAVPPGVHPDDFCDFDPRYTTEVTWSATAVDRFDVVFRSTTKPSADPRTALQAQPWSSYTNDPTTRSSAGLGPELRTHLRASLPDYMVPTAFVVLDALPRTPNGKIDRARLPAPDRARTEGATEAAPPENDFERAIAGVWQDMLSLDVIGVETNLFDLGANSLMMVQATSRISEALDRKISLVEMFRFPTVRSLANHLDVGDVEEAAAMKESHDRGQSRREAMLRRRDTRRGR